MTGECFDCAHSAYCPGSSDGYCGNHHTRREAAVLAERMERDRWERYREERTVRNGPDVFNMRGNRRAGEAV